MLGSFGQRAKERVLAPPAPQPHEHVLWDSPAGDKRITFKVRGENSYVITTYTRMDAMLSDKNDPGLTRDEVLKIIAKMLNVMADDHG